MDIQKQQVYVTAGYSLQSFKSIVAPASQFQKRGFLMPIDTPALLEALNSVISIPLIPFNGAQIDFEGHRKNIAYLMNNNYLSDHRPRVISIAGTSLIHHVREKDQVKLIDIAGQQMGSQGVLMAAVVPNPIGTAVPPRCGTTSPTRSSSATCSS